jgi:hypothetical protein
LAALVEDALVRWRRVHPVATIDEIMDAVDGELGRLRARYLADLAEGTDTGERACAQCGGRLEQRGRRAREVLLPGQAAPLRLERDYLVCSSCGAGVFPPG